MRVIKVEPENLRENEAAIKEAVRVINNGGVIVYPTDTVYGLGADATNDQAVQRLFKIKKRPESKAAPVFIDSVETAKKLAFIDKKIERILDGIWPGAVTIILQQKFKLPEIVTAGRRTIGLRIPDYKLVNFLLAKLKKPLIATSANISGQPPSTKIEEVLEQFKGELFQPDLVLYAGNLRNSESSTILDLSEPRPKINRIGPVSRDKLFEIMGG